MKLQDFLTHHGLACNPFADEDAQTDPVFQDRCCTSTFHPNWDKVYGDPSSPATSIVFGEKGAGTAAMRFQVAAQIDKRTRRHEDHLLFVVEYDDFTPYLDRFADRLSGRKRRHAPKVLAEWKLWDHMDAILTLATTKLADAIREPKSVDESQTVRPQDLAQLSRLQQRDVLLLAAFYDHNRDLAHRTGWQALRRKLGFRTWKTWRELLIGLVVTLVTVGLILWLSEWQTLLHGWVAAVLVAGLTVMVGTRGHDPVPGGLRAGWMRELLPDARVVHHGQDSPQEPSDGPDFWPIWRRAITALHPQPIDLVFGSDPYVVRLAEELEIKAGILINGCRAVVSGHLAGPGLFDLLAAIGQERVVARLRNTDRWCDKTTKD